MPHKVCVVSGSRADWGLLRAPARAIRDSARLELQLVATGSHLSARYGETVADLVRDGFTVDERIPILGEGDDSAAAIAAVARATAGFGEALARLDPDIVLVLGDRYEMLGVVTACLLGRVPVAHLCGGDVTEGAFDDAIRHAISKMAHLHFVTNEPAGRRLLRMGEDPASVHVAGSTGLDAVREIETLGRDAFFAALGLRPRARTVLVTFHPPTLDEAPGETQFDELASALDRLGPEVGVVLTGSNADPEGALLTERARAFAETRDNAVFRVSLGQKLYFSAMRHVDVVVGNSSSGLYEAPSFGIATVNIGDRQRGRLRATSVIDVPPRADAILSAIRDGFAGNFAGTVNPYGDGHAAERIVKVLESIERPRDLLRKTFHDGDRP